MVNTRILEQRLNRPGQSDPGEARGAAARALRHEPLLQGRIHSGPPRPELPAPAGRRPNGTVMPRADCQDRWAALTPVEGTLEGLAARQGKLPGFGRESATGVALDQLRSQILRVVQDKGWCRLGVAGARRGAGASFLALGLTASLIRLDYLHVLLGDLDLSRPSLHDYLGLDAPGPLDSELGSGGSLVDRTVRLGDRLALLLNARPAEGASELIYSPEATSALHLLDDSLRPDLTVWDLPPLLTDPAAQPALAQVDAVLLIADGTCSTARDIAECEHLLGGQVPLLGVVLNKSEDRRPNAGQG